MLSSRAITATRVFKYRFITFLHQVILNTNNPLCVQDHSNKVVFQVKLRTFIFYTNREVSKHNTSLLNDVEGDILSLKAVTYHKSNPNFSRKIQENQGTIGSTPFCITFNSKLAVE